MGGELSRDKITRRINSANLEIGAGEINQINKLSQDEIDRLYIDVTKLRIEGELIGEQHRNIVEMIGKFVYLKQVVLRRNELKGKQIEDIIAAISLKKFRLIDLSGNHVSLRATQILRSMMAEGKIKRLFLKSCDMDGKKLREILQGFRHCNDKVKALDISGNYVTKGVYDGYQDLLLHKPIVWDRKVRESSWKRAKKNMGKAVTTLTEREIL